MIKNGKIAIIVAVVIALVSVTTACTSTSEPALIPEESASSPAPPPEPASPEKPTSTPEAQTAPEDVREQEAGSNTISVYFVPGDDVEDKVLELINGAKTSVYAAVYDIDLESVSQALIEAFEKGVDVKVVMDDECASDKDSEYGVLEPLGIIKTDNNQSDFMHNKFIVVDNEVVWTGSTNLTGRGVELNNNNVIVVVSPKIAENYLAEFNEMWRGEFGGASTANTPYPEVLVEDILVECYFAPEDNVEDEIIEEIQDAQESVVFATFTFTSDPIEEILLSRWVDGISIRGIYEARQKSKWCSYQPLFEADVPVTWDGNSNTMHHKFFIIDSATVITGSYNPTKHANTANDENILIIHHSGIADIYLDEFNSLWGQWYKAEPTSEPGLEPADPTVPVDGVIIESVRLGDEIVVIANTGDEAVDLTGWKLISEVGSQEFIFPEYTLQPGASVEIVSGKGAEDAPPERLLWSLAYIWNNEGDPAVLQNAQGQLVSRYP